MTSLRRVVASVTLVVGVGPLALVGCGRGHADTLDPGATATEVQRVIGGRIEPDVDHVTCPTSIDRGTGTTFTCTAVLADGLGRVRLRVTQTDDGKSLAIALRDAVIDKQDAAQHLHRDLVETYHRSFTVDCGSAGPVVVKPGTTFTCQARDGAGKRAVKVTVVDPAGTFHFDIG